MTGEDDFVVFVDNVVLIQEEEVKVVTKQNMGVAMAEVEREMMSEVVCRY